MKARLKLLLQIPFASRQQRATAVASFEVLEDAPWKGAAAFPKEAEDNSSSAKSESVFQGEEFQASKLRSLCRRGGFLVAVKGAPERVKRSLAEVPAYYDKAAAVLASQVRNALLPDAASAAGAFAASGRVARREFSLSFSFPSGTARPRSGGEGL